MSTLQIALGLLGVVLLAVMAGHAMWRHRRGRPHESVDAPIGAQAGGSREALRQREPAEQREPHFAPFDTSATGGSPTGAPPGEAVALAPTSTLAAPAQADASMDFHARPSVRRVQDLRLDGLLDAMASITVEHPVSGELSFIHLPGARRAGSKPILIEGLDTETGEWETPRPLRRYGEFQAGVQLANRAGALNEIEYSEFVQKVQAFADAVGGLPDFPDMLDVVARGRELDSFADEHDAQLAMRLACGRAAWTLGYVQQHAARHGFVPGVLPGRLVLPSAEEGAPPVLVLHFDPQAALADEPQHAALRELRLCLDLPQTPRSDQPFAAWCAAGQALTLALDASLLDDSGAPLDPAAFATIGSDLESLYAALAERDLAAGSVAARRLFS